MADEFSKADGFSKADNEFGKQQSAQLVRVNPSDIQSPILTVPNDMMERRQQLIQRYHNAKGIVEKLKRENRTDIESLTMALIDELMQETDNLLGNALISMEEGNIRDATIISDKRAGVLTQTLKAVQTKAAFEREYGVDLDSPHLRIVFKYFMGNVHKAFKQLNYSPEASDTFFRALGKSMENWKDELKVEFDLVNTIGKKNGNDDN